MLKTIHTTSKCFALVAMAFAAVPAAFAQPLAPENAAASGVFVEQIGSGNSTTIKQSTRGSLASVRQEGQSNTGEIVQDAGSVQSASIEQTGDRNMAAITQGGDALNAAIITQTGNANTAALAQEGVRIGAVATIAQHGADNSALLAQAGSDNHANLAQVGDGNTMSASQIGIGNRLDWLQAGSGLSDLSVTQSGGATMQITQTN